MTLAHPSFHQNVNNDYVRSNKGGSTPGAPDGDTADKAINNKIPNPSRASGVEEDNEDQVGLGCKYQADSEEESYNYSFSTRDIISWSFQVARGMDYLASKKV